MIEPLAPAPHIRQAKSVQAIMLEVCLALIPAMLIHIYVFGPGIIVNFLVLCTFGLSSEYVLLRLRKQPVKQYLFDLSTVVTAILIAFALPPITPWWISALAMIFAIVVAKQLYGGLGFNIFNPAMAGYALILISFPQELSLWLAADSHHLTWVQKLAAPFVGVPSDVITWDDMTSATPLDKVQIEKTGGRMVSEIMSDEGLGTFGAWPWNLINSAVLAGGLWLVARKIIGWRIPVYTILSCALLVLVCKLINNDGFSGLFFHLFSGSLIMCAFFIATDPVSSATSKRGQMIYAGGIGVLVFCIREWGSYPDGVAFAVLTMNMFVPLIDHFTIPRAYGHKK